MCRVSKRRKSFMPTSVHMHHRDGKKAEAINDICCWLFNQYSFPQLCFHSSCIRSLQSFLIHNVKILWYSFIIKLFFRKAQCLTQLLISKQIFVHSRLKIAALGKIKRLRANGFEACDLICVLSHSLITVPSWWLKYVLFSSSIVDKRRKWKKSQHTNFSI